jgi:hypothetical protein
VRLQTWVTKFIYLLYFPVSQLSTIELMPATTVRVYSMTESLRPSLPLFLQPRHLTQPLASVAFLRYNTDAVTD